jgi:hypothetical protein
LNKIILVLLFLAGCTGYEKKPNQDRAVSIVWNGMYGETRDPPQIEWREDFCNPKYPDIAGVSYEGVCYAGLTFDYYLSMVAWRGNFSGYGLPRGMAFSHELLHAHQALDGIYDPNHLLPVWTTLVPAADKALADDGL